MFGIGRKTAWDGRRATAEAVDLLPPLWGLREDTQHVVTGYPICSCNDSSEVLGFCIYGKSMEYAERLDLSNGHCDAVNVMMITLEKQKDEREMHWHLI